MRTRFELADAVSLFGTSLFEKTTLTPLQLKVLGKISRCRTSALGGHEEACDNCGTVRYSYNSCGDRHCPKCQAAKQTFWVDDLMQSTLPVRHFHMVFTVPHQLNAICLYNQGMYYDILFASAWDTLYSFGYSRYGSETGAVAVTPLVGSEHVAPSSYPLHRPGGWIHSRGRMEGNRSFRQIPLPGAPS